MKKIPFLLLLMISLNGISQVYKLNIDKFQSYKYPKHLISINNAIAQDSVEYLDGGETNIDYDFNIDDSLLIYYYPETGKGDSLKIIYYKEKGQWEYEAWAVETIKVAGSSYDVQEKIYNYLITKDINDNLIFMCRWVEEHKVAGWFAPTINCINKLE